MSTPVHYCKIKCPFFVGDNFNSICCEGTLKNSLIRQSFESKNPRIEWEKKYCYGIEEAKSCPIYSLAYSKYN